MIPAAAIQQDEVITVDPSDPNDPNAANPFQQTLGTPDPSTLTPEPTAPDSALPDVQTVEDSEGSFSDAIDKALGVLNTEPDPEPEVTEPEPESKEPESKEDESKEPESTEPESKEDDKEGKTEEPEKDDSDPTNQLDTEVDDDDTSDWTPKAAKRFQELKAERKGLRAEIAEAKQKQVELENRVQELSGVDKDELSALQEKVENYEKDLMLTNLETTAAYQETITQPLETILDNIKGTATRVGVDPDALVALLSEPDDPAELPEYNEDGTPFESRNDRLEALLDGVAMQDKVRIFRLNEDIDDILDKRDQLYENVESATAEAKLFDEERAKAEAAENAKQRENVTRNVFDRLEEKLPFLAGLDLNIDSLKAEVAEVDPKVANIVDSQYRGAVAAIFPAIVKDYAAKIKEVESLMTRLAEYDDLEPDTSGAGGTPKVHGGAPKATTEGMTFEEALAAKLGA